MEYFLLLDTEGRCEVAIAEDELLQGPSRDSLNPAPVRASAGDFSQQLTLNGFKDVSQAICIPAHLQSSPASRSSAVSSLSGV